MELFLKKKDIRYGSKIRLSKGLSGTAAWPMAQKILCAFHCTGHSDEPLKAKIVFSIGFHDFRVSSPSYKSHLHNIFLCHQPGGSAGQTLGFLFQLAFWAVVKFKFV